MSRIGLLADDFKLWSNKAGLEIALRRVRRTTDRRRIIYFLHIGKAAGSQVKQAIDQINAGQSAVSMQAMRHDVTLTDIPEPAEYFFSIREPISRFRSGFYSRKRCGRPRNDIAWTPYEAEAFTCFEHANDLAEALFEPGESGMRALAAMKSIEHTAQDQIDWFAKAGDIFTVRAPIWVLRQEHFEQDFSTFLARANIPFEPRLARDSTGAHRNDYTQTTPLSDKARDNLRRWYSQDFAFYEAIETWMRRELAGELGGGSGGA